MVSEGVTARSQSVWSQSVWTMEPISMDRFYYRLRKVTWRGPENRKKRRRPSGNESPLETVLLRLAAGPKMDKLLAASGKGLPLVADKLINHRGADGWGDFLGPVSVSSTKALYRYVAAEAGNKEDGVTATEIAPLVEEGRYMIGGPRKSETRTGHVIDKLTAKR